jgi:hypothetical protein
MPIKIIKSAPSRFYNHLLSPITLRAVVFFLAVFLLGYIIVTESYRRQETVERRQRFNELNQTSHAALQTSKTALEQFDQTNKTNQLLLEYMREMNDSVATIHGLLRDERLARQKQLTISQPSVSPATPSTPLRSKSRRKAVRKKAASVTPKCFRLATRTKKYGETDVVETVLVPTECR